MHWIDKREEVTDRYGLHPVELPQGRHGLYHLRLIEGLQHVALGVEPFTDADALPTWGQEDRCFGIDKKVIHVGAFLAPNL